MPQKVRLGSEVAEGALLSAVGYAGPLFLLPLLLKRENRLCRFHGRQGLVLFAAEVAIATLGMILFGLLRVLTGLLAWVWVLGPFLDFLLNALVASAFWLVYAGATVGLSLTGAWKAWQGEYWEMPLLGRYAARISPRDSTP